jgi:hypothetical protein
MDLHRIVGSNRSESDGSKLRWLCGLRNLKEVIGTRLVAKERSHYSAIPNLTVVRCVMGDVTS